MKTIINDSKDEHGNEMKKQLLLNMDKNCQHHTPQTSFQLYSVDNSGQMGRFYLIRELHITLKICPRIRNIKN